MNPEPQQEQLFDSAGFRSGQQRLFNPTEFYDPAADPWRPENLTPYLSPEVVGDDTLHDWRTPSTWGDPASPSIEDGFGGWAA